ncbi:MAG TPA: FAD-linked oxidase C-terminal domain-containing protein [Bacteroidota bacterium]|nr:FAD-linked oxidase C-terminal domain-containing protein [Bacteroidota bacterium]
MIEPAVLDKICAVVGKENFLDSKEDRISYSYDGTPLLRQLPDAIAIPTDPDQISKILQVANEEHFAVVPRGSGSGLSGGSIPVENSIVLLMSRWNKILEIDSENLTALVEPGVKTAEIHAAVEKIGLFYPPDPGSMTICTIGGNVAENAGGLRGLKYGVTKNYVLGLETVLPNGEIIFSGGKTVKDVAGYNLKDFFVGSEGTLGVFSKILLKLIPKPETSKTMIAYFQSAKNAAEVVSSIIAAHIIPATIEFLDRTTIKCVEEYAHLGLPTNIESLLLIEVDGRPSVVEEDAAQVQEICTRHGCTQLMVARTLEEAFRLKTARRAAFSALARVKPTTILEDVTVPRSEVALMLERINSIAKNHNVLFGNFGHAGDGNLHPTCLTDERDADEIKRAELAFDEIFNASIKMGGTITGEHGTGLAKKKFLPQVAGIPAIGMMQSIKSSIDPNGVLNPGKIFSLRPKCEGNLPRNREQIKKFEEQGAWT